MDLQNKIDEYFKLQQELYEMFGYQEDWRIIPLQDETKCYWFIKGLETSSASKVVYSPLPFTMEAIKSGETIYSGTIYTQRYLPKYVYKAETHTMVAVDTHCDDNKVLMLFDNSKKETSEELITSYNWQF